MPLGQGGQVAVVERVGARSLTSVAAAAARVELTAGRPACGNRGAV